MTRNAAAIAIEAFLEGRSGKWDWDEFLSLRIEDPRLDDVRALCARLPEIDPPVQQSHYCGSRGMTILRRLAQDLKMETELPPLGNYLKSQPR